MGARVRWRRVVLGLIAALLVPEVGAAQCAGGRAVSEATAGRCCWPGQRWDDERGRCAGEVGCPEGGRASGEGCARAPRRHRVDAPIEPLVVSGLLTALTGYVFTTTAAVGASGRCNDGLWEVAYAPVGGGFAWAGLDGHDCFDDRPSRIGDTFGLPGSAVQVLGLVLATLGALLRLPEERRVAPWDDGVRF